MIKFLRELCFHDFWLKLFSLALAVLIWLTVSFAVQKEAQVRTFSDLQVKVTSETQDVSNIKTRPSVVEVTVQGERNLIHDLRASDIRVTVDVSGIRPSGDVRKRLEFSTLAGVSLVRVEPQEVEVLFPHSQ